MKIIAILPAFNEEESIGSLLNKYEQLSHSIPGLKVLVVNDGSTDNTATLVQSFVNKYSIIQLIHNDLNAGLGKVLLQGLKQAILECEGDDIIITMDSDDSHDPQLIPKMIHELDNDVEMVIASRYQAGSEIVGLNILRRWTGYGAGILFQILTPIPGVRDFTCGYRAYKANLIQKGFEKFGDKLIEEKGFSCMAEVLLKLSIFKPKIKEIPFILRYDLKKGASKMKVWATIKKTLLLILNHLKNK